jgi:hypothetical protein
MPSVASRPMTALATSVFTALGIHLEFGTNDGGAVTRLIFHTAEGDFRADRKK